MAELDFVDTAVSLNVNTTGSVTLLNPLIQGTNASNRIGRKCLNKSIQVLGRVFNDTTATVNQVAVSLVYDTQANGAAPVYTDVFDTVTPESMLNISNIQRFKMLRMWNFALIGNTTTPACGEEQLVLDDAFKCNLVTQFKASNNGDVTDIATGALYLLTCGQTAAGTGDAAMVGTIRIRYIA